MLFISADDIFFYLNVFFKVPQLSFAGNGSYATSHDIYVASLDIS